MILLTFTAVIYGLITAALFRYLVNRDALRGTLNRILAHLIAFRLFVDEPALVLRGQLDLLREHLRLFRLLLWPLLAAGIILALSWNTLDARLGQRPIPAGGSAVLTLPLGSELKDSPDFIIETPPVRIPRLHETSWRVRAVRESPALTEPVQMYGAPWPVWFLIVSGITATGTATLARR